MWPVCQTGRWESCPRRSRLTNRRTRWYRIVHGEDVLEWLSIAAVERILAEHGVNLDELVDAD